MRNEQAQAALVARTGYCWTTVRRWWRWEQVRQRTATALGDAAKELGLRRPKRSR
jgi:hypothetical protein